MKNNNLLKKAVILIAGCLLIAALLPACSGSRSEDPGKAAEQEAPEKEEEESTGEDPEKEKKMAEVNVDNISVNTQSSIKIKGSLTVYIDPYKITKEAHDADVILITHSHYDHLDPASIKNVAKEYVPVVCPKTIAGEVRAALDKEGVEYDLADMEVGSKYTFKNREDENKQYDTHEEEIDALSVRAYNKDKSFHKKEYDWFGYVFTLDGIKYFDAGDSDVIPEYESPDFEGIDVAFLPIGGTYTMTAEEAASLADKIKPKYLIPIHYGSIVGSRKDVDTLKSSIKGDGIKVVEKVEDAK